MGELENYKDTKVNSYIYDDEKSHIMFFLKNYLYHRIWDDEKLLNGFNGNEIDNIINATIEEYGDDINQFVAVMIEKCVENKFK